MNRTQKLAIFLHSFLSLGALGGGVALMVDPLGTRYSPSLELLKGSPFPSYFIPGLCLFSFLGVLPIVCSVLTVKRDGLVGWTLCGVGTILLIWMLVEIDAIGFTMTPPLQPFYLAYAVVMIALGIRQLMAELRQKQRR